MGYFRSLNNRQRIAWVLPIGAFAMHMVGISPTLNFPINMLSLVIYPLGCLLSLGMMYKVSRSKLMDSTVPMDYKYCGNCQRKVPRNSKHCRICKLCVEEFDHHCKWLNKCIGKPNYKLFICMLSSFALSYGLGLSLSIFAVSDLADENVYDLNSNAYLGFCILIITMEGTLLLIVIHLLCLHAFLKLKSMSTYEFITLMRMRSSKVSVQVDTNNLRIRQARLFTVKEEPDSIYSPPLDFKFQDRQAAGERILKKIMEEVEELDQSVNK